MLKIVPLGKNELEQALFGVAISREPDPDDPERFMGQTADIMLDRLVEEGLDGRHTKMLVADINFELAQTALVKQVVKEHRAQGPLTTEGRAQAFENICAALGLQVLFVDKPGAEHAETS